MAPIHWLPPSVSTLILSRSSPELIEEAPDNIQTIVEAWAQGVNVGAFIVLILFTLCNYRGRVLLHKLILLELVFAIWHGLFIFFKEPVYGWYASPCHRIQLPIDDARHLCTTQHAQSLTLYIYRVLSGTAIPLYLSYNIHNVISWIKIKPFLPRWGGRLFIISLALVQPYWILETYANFQYFNNLGGDIFRESRFYEPLTRCVHISQLSTACSTKYAWANNLTETHGGYSQLSSSFSSSSETTSTQCSASSAIAPALA
jgi:hypothetical protein